jgi:hypothetical protein
VIHRINYNFTFSYFFEVNLYKIWSLIMEIKNSHQVTSVCHCITRNDQMYVVHIGSNDYRGCGTKTNIKRSPDGYYKARHQ